MVFGKDDVMNHVERFNAVMNFKDFDRLPIVEWAGWWDKTIDRWREEGLSEDLADKGEIREALGLDCWRQLWISPQGRECPKPESHGAGIIGSERDYENIKPFLYPEDPFDGEKYSQWRALHEKGDMVIWITLLGFFWFPRNLFGIEKHLYSFYDHPDLMKRINRDLVDYNLRALDKFCNEVCTPEFMTFAEDMSYNHGPMLSKELFDEFLAPCYRQIVPALEERGILPVVDSDGDVTEMIPWLESVGVKGLLPWEKQSGVDIAEVRKRHPEFRMIGGFDKTVMKHGESAMRAEFERLLPVMRQGGYIPGVDHQTPPDVSLELYRDTFLPLLREYCERAANE
jgi:hypothetical protein